MFNHRLIFITVFVAVSVVSGRSSVQVRAEGEDLGSRTYFRVDGGYLSYEQEPKFLYKYSDAMMDFCHYDNALRSINGKLLSDCLADKSLTLEIVNNLSPCDDIVTIPCIEGVFARNDFLKPEWISGIYSGERPQFGSRWDALPEYETGRSHEANLYMFPGLGSNPDQLYQVAPTMRRRVAQGALLNPLSVDVSIRAVSETTAQNSSYNAKEFSSGSEMAGKLNYCNASGNDRRSCWKIDANPMTNQFKLVLRLPALPSGWLQGRMFLPKVAFEAVIGATSQPYRVTLTGSPISTPRITRVYFSDIPSERILCPFFLTTVNLQKDPQCFEEYGLNAVIRPAQISQYTNLVKTWPEFDVATDIVDEWKVVMTFGIDGVIPYGGCAERGEFIGFVSSNAMVYSDRPLFDIAQKSLNYVVGGPHFMPDKSVFSGLYSMIITKEFAKCQWGLTKPVFSASLQVIDQDGLASNAVTTLGTDTKYIYFSATGFTYSQKTLKVKFANTAKALNDSKKKITCVKGKTVRTVTGVNPVCPKGFKVKK